MSLTLSYHIHLAKTVMRMTGISRDPTSNWSNGVSSGNILENSIWDAQVSGSETGSELQMITSANQQ